ncbi:protein TRANSPARENT TESTA 9 isoform X3 [Cucumis melo]|uniref:Protein TRANSPARENT TESTA 9 isoform X3 n=1 Tax=Cucumis melo TaxID=3656 RepID=A0ABM3KRL1_CUCME|nr:protein TRANSPARENT TESTA 9 isoform X3 [Cucumis melo]
MWFSFWRSRDRFSLEELRYLTDQLQKIQIVNEVNKDFVIEALRSISELITYGDQHDASFFEFFMEKQIMGEFVRILKISRAATVSLQLLQTMSIIIQNLKSEHAIYYLFSTEHMNKLITYAFDFRNDELLSYYISFLRAISGKLNKNTISLLVKTQNDKVVSFPMYVEAIQFAFHEENMIRTAVRALTLNVYHVGDDYVNRFITSPPHADYFSNLVTFFRKQCIDLNDLVTETMRSAEPSTSTILAAVDEIEDNLYYISDVISAGIPDVGRLITDNILRHLIFPLLLPSLRIEGFQIGAVTSLYLLCCILRIVKIKDLANTISAAFFCPLDAFSPQPEEGLNGNMTRLCCESRSQSSGSDGIVRQPLDAESLIKEVSDSSAPKTELKDVTVKNGCPGSRLELRGALLSHITTGDDVQVLGALSVLATLLQTKGQISAAIQLPSVHFSVLITPPKFSVELDESMLDALGILPQRKQHKKLLLEALVGEDSGEEQLFSSDNTSVKGGIDIELDGYLQKLKDYGISYFLKAGASPRAHRFEVLDALVSLFCRSNISAEILWDGGWLLRQLLPYSEAEFNSHHLKLLKDSYKYWATELLQEARGIWSDFLIILLSDEWKKCKRAIEAPSPRKEPKSMLLHSAKASAVDAVPPESSFAAGQKMSELVKHLPLFPLKVFVLLHQLQSFSLGKALSDQPCIDPPSEIPDCSRAKVAGLDASGPKPGAELRLDGAVPCRIAFERGKERHFFFLGTAIGTCGWIILAEELPSKLNCGIVRVAAPLAGSNPRIDEKHSRWLHLRIRPSTLPFLDPTKHGTPLKSKAKPFVDGRWILAFQDEDTCKVAFSMVLEEINLQSKEVERRLKPLVGLERAVDSADAFLCSTKSLTSNTAPNLM